VSKKHQDKIQRDQLHREIEQVRDALDGYRPMDQDQRAKLARTTQRLIHETFDLGDREAWRQALDLEKRVLSIAYPPGFWESYECLKAGDPAGLEIAVRFLEDDPWFFRSGYAKERLLRYIKRIDIAARYLPRLEKVLLNAVDSRDRREFRQFCHLAREIGGDSLRQELTQRLDSDESGVQRRAGWMLEAIND
jgi:hypothetical protein